MKNKKGFSTVELLVSFVIISFISISMFRAVLLLNDKLFYYQNTSRLILFNGTFTNSMTKDLLNNQIDSITVCGTNCYDITYQTLITKRLKLDNDAETLQYGDIVQKLPMDARFTGDIAFNSQSITGIPEGRKNAILNVTVPITSDVVTGDYSINVVYQYDDRLITVPIPLSSRFSAASASANGATGTYIPKNGSNYFVGINPNNWIEFGQVSSTDATPLLWRIIRSDNEGIKIIYEGVKNGSSIPTANGVAFISRWDSVNNNKWDRPALLKTLLTDWYDNLYVNNKNSYVQPIGWCIGAISGGADFPASQILTSEFLTYECNDGTYPIGGSYNGKTVDTSPVGLIKASDYISTSSATTCTGSYSTNPVNNEGSDCGIMPDGTVTNFLKKTYWWPTINAFPDNITGIFLIRGEGGVSVTNVFNTTGNIRPVINLKADVSYVGGNGSLTNPYKINGPKPLLRTKFSSSSASANGSNGTYASKNGSNYFIGPNPNNWIEFGQVSNYNKTPLLWRIIKNDDEGIKIIYEGIKNGTEAPTADGQVGKNVWDSTGDTNGSNKWNRPADLKAVLASWYNNFTVINKATYVQPTNWCVGGITFNDPTTTADFLANECRTWTHASTGTYDGYTNYVSAVGLIKASDYISTSSAPTCIGGYQVSGNNNGSDCGKLSNGAITNFLYKNYAQWTMNAHADYTYSVWHINATGNLNVPYANGTNDYVRPVINLKPDVLYANGDGRLINPYRLALP